MPKSAANCDIGAAVWYLVSFIIGLTIVGALMWSLIAIHNKFSANNRPIIIDPLRLSA